MAHFKVGHRRGIVNERNVKWHGRKPLYHPEGCHWEWLILHGELEASATAKSAVRPGDQSWRGRATEASESLGAHSYFSPTRDWVPSPGFHTHSPFQGTRFVSYELNSWDLEIECHQQSRRQEDKRLSLRVGHWKILNSPKEKNLSKWSLVPQRKKPACFQSCYDESQLTKPMIRVLVPHSQIEMAHV